MEEKFRCKHCRNIFKKNPRIKLGQGYCNNKNCQQKRKNKWERDKLGEDPCYNQKRKIQKQNWYQKKPGYQYQRDYRQKSKAYRENNVEKQRSRNQNSISLKTLQQLQSPGKEAGEPHLFYLIPYSSHSKKNIVKTDALIVSINCLPAP